MSPRDEPPQGAAGVIGSGLIGASAAIALLQPGQRARAGDPDSKAALWREALDAVASDRALVASRAN